MDRGLGNVRVQARIAEIMRVGAERAEVTVEQVVRELKLIGFSDIRSATSSSPFTEGGPWQVLARSCRSRLCDITADIEGRTDMSRTSRDGRV